MDEGKVLLNPTLEKLHESYKAGNGEALLSALDLCLQFEHPVPKWVSDGWRHAYSESKYGFSESIESVLGIERSHPKTRQKKLYSGLIWQYISRHKQEGAIIDIGLFEECADHLNELLAKRRTEAKGRGPIEGDWKFSRTKVSEMYYEMLHELELHSI